jgi:hypothetical protein
MIKLPQGRDLVKALEESGISTQGMPRSAGGGILEEAMQARLLEVMRDDRDQRAVKNSEALAGFTRNWCERRGRSRLLAAI